MTASERLNQSGPEAAEALLTRCCASRKWVERMLAARPFADDERLQQMAGEVWWSLDEDDWREAFAAHPRIGDVASLRAKYANTAAWAAGEQAGTQSASEETLRQLAAGNRDYEARFGYLFIVCATGKSAGQMLAILQGRLPNRPDEEMRIAAGEQLKITQLRLAKLRGGDGQA